MSSLLDKSKPLPDTNIGSIFPKPINDLLVNVGEKVGEKCSNVIDRIVDSVIKK